MKTRLLFLVLLFSFGMYGQNPTKFEKIKITANTQDNGVARILVQDATTGEVKWILKSILDGKFNQPTGNSTQYLDGAGNPTAFPTLNQADRVVAEVRNETGATVTKGTVVYLNGARGGKALIQKAQANAELTSSGTFGVIQSDINNNANGYAVIIGSVTGLNTSSYTAGNVLWLSPTVAGGYTTTKPSATNHAVYVGIVTASSTTQGSIEVKIQNGYELDELHNVSITSNANNDALIYDSAIGLWKNKQIVTDAIVDGTTTVAPSQNAVFDALATKEPTIASGTTSQYYRGDKTWQTLDKTAVGLSNVDNTSDLNKPISTATQTALNAKENTANKNTANGYAGLGSDGKLISNQLPAITITDTFVVGSQSAMLALTAETGDVAVRTDLSKSYILKGSNPSVLADWQELLSPVDGVTSVFGRVGSVVANTGDYTTAQVTETTNKKYQTDAQALYNDATSSIQTQLNGKEILTNKSTATTLGTSNTLYPTQNAVKTYVDNKVGSGSGSLEFNSTDLTVWNNGKSNVDTNISFGEGALRSNTTGGWNTAYGQSTLYNNTTGNFNTAVGLASLPANISGQLNTALGYGALNTSSTGNENTGLGSASLGSNTSGNDNLASGYNSLGFNTTGSNNVALGVSAGSYISPSGNNTLSNQSVYLGAQTKTFANNQTNEIVVGYGAVGNGSNTATIGNSSITRTVLNGNVGIGTSSSGSATLNILNQASSPFLALRSTNNVYEIAKMSFDQNTDILSIINNQGAISSGITFGTNNSERMRITSSGNVGIGTTSPSAKLNVLGDFHIGDYGTSETRTFETRTSTNLFAISTFPTNADGTLISYSRANGGQGPLKFANASMVVMNLTAGGQVLIPSLGTGIVYSNNGTLTSTNPSDKRLKDNILDLSYGLNEILKLRPVTYNWKNDAIKQGKQFGFIAQEVQEVMPDLVKEFKTDEGDRLGLNKEGIYTTLIKAIQEQQAQIKELQKEIEILKNK